MKNYNEKTYTFFLASDRVAEVYGDGDYWYADKDDAITICKELQKSKKNKTSPVKIVKTKNPLFYRIVNCTARRLAGIGGFVNESRIQLKDLLKEYIKEDTASDVTKMFGGISGGIKTAGLKRIAVLSSQGRYDEAGILLRSHVRNADAFNTIMDYLKKNLKPIPNATSEKLSDNPKYNEWLNSHWLPFITKYVK